MSRLLLDPTAGTSMLVCGLCLCRYATLAADIWNHPIWLEVLYEITKGLAHPFCTNSSANNVKFYACPRNICNWTGNERRQCYLPILSVVRLYLVYSLWLIALRATFGLLYSRSWAHWKLPRLSVNGDARLTISLLVLTLRWGQNRTVANTVWMMNIPQYPESSWYIVFCLVIVWSDPLWIEFRQLSTQFDFRCGVCFRCHPWTG